MRGILCQIQPWNPATGARETISVGSASNSLVMGLNGIEWQSVIVVRPRLSMEIVDDDLTGGLMTGRGDMTLNLNALRGVTEKRNLEWEGAPITIWSGNGPTFADMAVEFVGLVRTGVINPDSDVVPISFEVDSSRLDVPLLTLEYTGGGGANGDPELRGKMKPAGFGSPKNVPPLLINATNNIYQVDGYGHLSSIAGVYESLASMGASFGNYASYADLLAAAVPPGRWATCIAEGLIKLGAPPTGVITCDPVFPTNRPGSVMLRWLQTHAGISASNIRTTDFDALTAAVNYPVSYWTDNTETVMDLLQRMCASCNAMPLLMLDGRIGVSRIFGGAESVTLQRRGGSPTVTAWQTMAAPKPWWRMKLSAARVYRVHSENEIHYEDDITDQGDYQAGETYRQGHVVRNPADGIRYLYINATPSAGNAPPNAAYWSVYEVAPDASNVRYASGATVESLMPAAAGADPTASNTAAAITGQGTLATRAFAALGDTVRRADGTTLLTDALAVTSLGTASAIAGQGALATLGAADWGTHVANRPAALTTLTNGRLHASNMQYGDAVLVSDRQPAEAGANVTGNHTAAAILNQGALAVRGTARLGFHLLREDDVTILTDALAVTSLGTASAITGQGGLATLGAVGFGSTVSGAYGRILRENGVQVTDALAVTSLGTASAIAGQGALATKSKAGFFADLETLPYFLTDGATNVGTQNVRPRLAYLNYDNGVSGESLRPGEVGANVTETRTASAISGQTAWATLGTTTARLNHLLDSGRMRLGDNGGLTDEAQSVWLTNANTVTANGTAAAIANQGALATLSRLTGSRIDAPLSGITINADPGLKDPTIYEYGAASALSIASHGGFFGARAFQVTANGGHIFTEVQPLDPAKTYRVTLGAANSTGSDRTVYLTVAFYDGSMNLITGADYAGGWPALGTYHYYGLVNGIPPTDGSVAHHSITFGPGLPTTAPPNARYIKIGWLPSYQGTTGTQYVGSAQLVEVMAFERIATNAVRLGSNVRRNDATTMVTDAMAITSEGTASAIANQGALATRGDADISQGHIHDGGAGALSANQIRNSIVGDAVGGSGIVRVPFPLGGGYSYTGGGINGALKIELPFNGISTMITFEVDVYDYDNRTSGKYIISGYPYGSDGTWVNVSAQYVGSESRRRTVRFGQYNSKSAVSIGETDSFWAYPQIAIKNFHGGYTGASRDWEKNWRLTLDANPLTNANGGALTRPHAGEGVFGENMLEASAGAVATVGNFKTGLGTASAISGQGALATKNKAGFFADLESLPYFMTDGASNAGTQNVRPRLAYMNYDDGNSGQYFKPEDVNSNRTEIRTSSAISGQGALATVNNVSFSHVLRGAVPVSNNMIANGAAELGTTQGWGIGWSNSNGGNSFTAPSGNYSRGSNYFLLTKAASNASEYIAVGNFAVPVVPGKRYRFSVMLNGSANTPEGLYLMTLGETSAWSAGNTAPMNSTASHRTDHVSNGPIPGVQTRYDWEWTCPANIVWAGVNILFWPTSVACAQMAFSDVIIEEIQPINKGLNSVTGRANSSFVSAGDAKSFGKLVYSGEAANGTAVSFGQTFGSVPKITMLPGGKGPQAGANIAIRADALTASGFTMKATEQTVTKGSAITDTGGAAGVDGFDYVIEKTQTAHPYDGKYTYNFQVSVPEVFPGEPGHIHIGIYAKKGGVWTQVATVGYSSTGNQSITVSPGSIDSQAGYEFAVDKLDGTGTITGFASVTYTLGTITETTLTDISNIPFVAFLEQ